MRMDSGTRNELRLMVIGCRKTLESSLAELLEGQYGIDAKGQISDPSTLKHLDSTEQVFREELVSQLNHIIASGFKPKDAVTQLVREVAFTHFNRLCAYKLLEQRGHIREAVSRGIESNGFLRYLADHKENYALFTSGKQDLAYRHFLIWQGSVLSDEIGVLFSPYDPANRLFPSHRVIEELLVEINKESLKDIWKSDETIGWIYQYFTPKELRDKARSESQAPRNSYELAFRNQFFTPRYVVQFLTDNTLGRIWYEMHQGKTSLATSCEYMVRYPHEVFLKSGEPLPTSSKESKEKSREELLKDPWYIQYRERKDPRNLRIMDPACGSGHFLLYCFDILEVIYREAWEDSQGIPFTESGKTLRDDFPDMKVFQKEIPGLILRHNLHGIDIDLRATQIATLALWLRAQRSFHELGIPREQRPHITRSNIVCAEPMPGEKELLEEFIATLNPPVLGGLVRTAFEKMNLAGEAGSLLKIEEEIAQSIAAAKQQWLSRPKDAQLTLFPTDKKLQWETSLYNVSGISDASFWDIAEQKVLEALHDYAKQASNGAGYRRAIFAEDAARGFAFIELCGKKYDVVLMNPPFGDVSILSRDYLYHSYISATQDIFSAFIERAAIWSYGGYIGAITNRLAFSRELLKDWREKYLLSDECSLTVSADLGFGVLDAAVVEAAAYVISNNYSDTKLMVINALNSKRKEEAILDSLRTHNNFFIHPKKLFKSLPNSSISYWCSPKWLLFFDNLPKANEFGIISKKGLETGDDEKFLRLKWEINPGNFKPFKKWTDYAKGGPYQPFFLDIHLVFNYSFFNEARRVSNLDLYGKSGLTYSSRTTSSFVTRILPKHCIISPKGPGIFSFNEQNDLGLMCFLNSQTAAFIMELMVGGGETSVKGSAARDFLPTSIEMMPVPNNFDNVIADLSKNGSNILQNFFKVNYDETNPRFHCIYLNGKSIQNICFNNYEICERKIIDSIKDIQHAEKLVMQAYNLTDVEFNDLLTLFGNLSNVDSAMTLEKERYLLESIENGDIVQMCYEIENNSTKKSCRMLSKCSFSIDPLYERLSFLLNLKPETIQEYRRKKQIIPKQLPDIFSSNLLSYLLGSLFGRWDIRYATGEKQPPELPNPFAPLPACSPGMLQGDDGLPLLEAPPGYPLKIDDDGILVDDEYHPEDIITRLREVLALLWGERADAIEQEACEILGVKSLRDYFRKPGSGGFWDSHVKRYSKSRRKAPIYWLLQSSKKNYALWIYYHRLTPDTLFRALERYVKPKIQMEETRLAEMQSELKNAGTGGEAVKRLEKAVEKQEAFVGELADFKEKLERAASLFLEPDLDDGVVLTIAPLHELVPWKEAEAYWEELLEGKYEWSSIGKQMREKRMLHN